MGSLFRSYTAHVNMGESRRQSRLGLEVLRSSSLKMFLLPCLLTFTSSCGMCDFVFINDHSGPGRALGRVCVCVSLCPEKNCRAKSPFDLDTIHAGSS